MSRKVGITFGTFDFVHAGHCHLFEQAKKQCDYLIVGLQTDPTIDRSWKNKPVQSVYERWYQLKSNKYVDEIIPYATEEELVQILRTQQIDVRIIGDDYLGKDFTGKELGSELEIETVYIDRSHGWSSSHVRTRMGDNNNSAVSANK